MAFCIELLHRKILVLPIKLVCNFKNEMEVIRRFLFSKWMSKKTQKWLVRFLQTSIMIREER